MKGTYILLSRLFIAWLTQVKAKSVGAGWPPSTSSISFTAAAISACWALSTFGAFLSWAEAFGSEDEQRGNEDAGRCQHPGTDMHDDSTPSLRRNDESVGS